MPRGVYVRTKPNWNTGLTKETDERVAKASRNISKSMKGKPSGTKGKHWYWSEESKANAKGHCGVHERTPEMNQRNREAQLKFWKDPREREKVSRRQIERFKNPEERERQSKRMMISQNRPEVKAKISESGIKRYQDPKEREKMSELQEIAQNRLEVKEKKKKGNRISWERRAEGSGFPRNWLMPNFNFESVAIYRILDRILHTRSRYGGTKDGEKKIGKYFVDCFNEEYKLIIEWNENEHYDFDGNLKEYDIKKREYVLAKYPDYTYIIIKQGDWFEKDNLTEEIIDKIVDYILVKLGKHREELILV